MKKVKKVFKYGTGQEIPEGAIYLSTVKQEQFLDKNNEKLCDCWLVWHYFLVEVEI